MTNSLLARVAGLFAFFLIAANTIYAQQCSSPCWSTVNQAPQGVQPFVPLLLTDGSVMIQNWRASDWYKLTPDSFGSYVNGTWTQLASITWAPLFFASAVLSDGKVIVEGGEYDGSDIRVWSDKGALYDPMANTWTPVSPPTGWLSIGDAQSVVLANGNFMLAQTNSSLTSKLEAILDEGTLTWTATGTGKHDANSEEGWTLLPNGLVLTVDTNPQTLPDNSEKYNPNAVPPILNWTSAQSTGVQLWSNCGGGCNEMGPAVLLQNGKVFATGASTNDASSGHTAVYSGIGVHSWSPGPDLPTSGGHYLDMADTPAALLPDGNVLLAARAIGGSAAVFLEWTPGGTTFAVDPNPSGNPPAQGAFLMLPTGQVMYTSQQSTSVYVYTPSGNPCQSCAPTITSFPGTVTPGAADYLIQGTQFNGLSQDSMFGDDLQNATNYPLVRITNNNTGQVVYCKTHDHSTMGVATGSATVSTHFDVPLTIGTGASTLVVVANGVSSAPASVQVQ
jgi:hypothetical protein